MATTLKAIGKGSKGPLVTSVQNFLRGKSYAVTADGKFGEKTEAAVKDFQSGHSLVADGWVGDTTLKAMMREGMSILDDSDRIGGTVGQATPRPPFQALAGNAERGNLFGAFQWKKDPDGDAEAIIILGDWESKNIVQTPVPQLKTLGLDKDGFIRCHKKVAHQFTALFAAWEKAGLLPLIHTYEGAFVARLVRGSKLNLSNHSFGSAFDINYVWNQLGCVPAAEGKLGSVRELVRIAHEYGFYWGGHFSRLDGMHFEVAVILPQGRKLRINYDAGTYIEVDA